MALVLSLLFILLLRLVAGPLVLVLILGVLGVLAYGIYHCWEEYRVLRDEGASITQLGITTNLSAYRNVQETWLAALIVLAVLEGILLLMLIFLRQRIRIAIALLEEASKSEPVWEGDGAEDRGTGMAWQCWEGGQWPRRGRAERRCG